MAQSNEKRHAAPSYYLPWLIWSLAAAFFFTEYFARVSPSVMTAELMRAFKINAFALGTLASLFYYAYISMQLPVGILMDRYGCRRLLTVTALLCGLSCILFGIAHHLYIAELARFIMGFSAAFAFVGALKLASEWFPPYRFGLLAGMTQALGMLGAAFGEGPVSLLVAQIGWRSTMLLIGGILLLIALLMSITIKNRPHYTATSTPLPPLSLIASFLLVIKQPQTWINGIAVGFLYAPTETFAELWGPTYLENVHHLKPAIASSAVGMVFIGWFISSPIMGWVSDRLGRRQPIVIASVIGSFITMTLVLYLPHLSTLFSLICNQPPS
jgi:sugar phosphate permease